jgi:hypothetical protein
MENKNKKQILVGILIVLILMNLAALGTFGYKKYCGHHKYENQWNKKNKHNENPQDRVKNFMKRELELKDDQFKKYCELKDINSKNMDEIRLRISVLRESSKMEITNESPDTLKLMQLADSLGLYHKKMLIEMNRHFLSVKKILEPAQIKKYNEMLRNINKGEWNKRGDKGKMKDTCDK